MTDSEILDSIIAREGGYVDHPLDRGRATNYGITMQTLREWRGKPVTADDVRALTEQEARDIYTARYLKPFANLPSDIKPQVVDIAVNSGVSTARALLARASSQTARSVNTQLVVERLMHYAGIVAARPTQSVFLRGWVKRAVGYL